MKHRNTLFKYARDSPFEMLNVIVAVIFLIIIIFLVVFAAVYHEFIAVSTNTPPHIIIKCLKLYTTLLGAFFNPILPCPKQIISSGRNVKDLPQFLPISLSSCVRLPAVCRPSLANSSPYTLASFPCVTS